MKRFFLGLAVTAALVASAPAAGASFTARTLSDAHVGKTKQELRAQASYSRNVIEFFTVRHRWMIAPRHASCWSIRGPSYRHLCDRARRRVRDHRWLRAVANRRLDAIELRELLRSTATYLGAVSYVERYFGPQPFLRNCPNGEGGYGEFVYIGHATYPIYGADRTPGGWLQFMGGTFYGIIDRAIASARARGMYVPVSARDWYSPLGQALAGRQMVEDGRRGEWTGPNC